MAERFHGEVLLHLEFQRRFGKVTCSSLPLVRYRNAERLNAIMAELDGKGVAVSNPHTFLLDNAGWKRVDAPQAEFKRLADPCGLMNPGKLKDWQSQAMSECCRHCTSHSPTSISLAHRESLSCSPWISLLRLCWLALRARPRRPDDACP